jgi:hypothetical protein
MTKKRAADTFVRLLERGVRDVLKDKDTSAADKLKAIDVGAKIAAIQHKIAGGKDDESFFN